MDVLLEMYEDLAKTATKSREWDMVEYWYEQLGRRLGELP